MAEYSNQSSPTPQVSYLTSDTLGTPRINTDQNGNVIARHDYLPFGEEIDSSVTAIRNVNLNYGDDGIKKKFTSYERDNESDLDFGQARYYSSKLGRFYSVDPENAGAMEDDPQSWNGYAYSRNNPVLITDPDGEKWRVCDGQGNCTEISDADAKNTLFNRSGNHPEVKRENGQITDEDGNPAGTYERISFDDFSPQANALFFGSRGNVGLVDRAPAMLKLTTIMGAGSLSIIAAPVMADLAVGAGASALETQLANTILSSGQIARTFISNGQNRLLHRLFTTGIIPKELTKEAVIAYIEIAKRAIAEGIDKGVQAERLKQLQEVLKKMK